MTEIEELEIFYFSGTGNARRIAEWFSENALKKEIDVKIINIANIDFNAIQVNPNSLVIIISPIHGFNYPKITLDFIRHFPNGENKIVLMNTRAGLKVGPFVTPGLTGIAFLFSSIILKWKGYKLVGQVPFDMPSNWISIHPSLNEKSVKYIHQKNYYKVSKHANKIFSGRKDFLALRDIVQDILIAPISLLYYFFGRFAFAKSFYASYKCDNCGICIKECPVNAIKIIKDRPFWTFHCESCMKCMNSCPNRAIETAHGLFALVILLSPIVTSFAFYYFVGKSFWEDFPAFIFKNIIFFSLLFLLYRMQHYFLGRNVIRKIIAFTSLTFFKFWGRYRSISDVKWKNVN